MVVLAGKIGQNKGPSVKSLAAKWPYFITGKRKFKSMARLRWGQREKQALVEREKQGFACFSKKEGIY